MTARKILRALQMKQVSSSIIPEEIAMRIGLTVRLTVLISAILVMGADAGQQQTRVSPAEPAVEVSFSLTRLPENPKQYSLVVSDSNERVVSGNFSIDQLQVLREIMVEAAKFARTGDAAGTRNAITTRFADQQEKSFIVDVQKLGPESDLFLTLDTEGGRLTSEAGHLSRSLRRDSGFFFDLLSRLESILPKQPASPAK